MFGSDLQTHHRTSFVDDMDCILVQGIDCIVRIQDTLLTGNV